jgi:hypothetical protein
VGNRWIIDPTLKLIHDDFVFLEISMMVSFVADAVVLVGGKIGAEFVHLFEG